MTHNLSIDYLIFLFCFLRHLFYPIYKNTLKTSQNSFKFKFSQPQCYKNHFHMKVSAISLYSSQISKEMNLHLTHNIEKSLLTFTLLHINTSRLYQLQVSQFQIQSAYHGIEKATTKQQHQTLDDEFENEQQEKLKMKKTKTKGPSSLEQNINKGYKSIYKYFKNIHELYGYLKRWMQRNKYDETQSNEVQDSTDKKALLSNIKLNQIKKRQLQIKDYQENNIYDSQMESMIVNQANKGLLENQQPKQTLKCDQSQNEQSVSSLKPLKSLKAKHEKQLTTQQKSQTPIIDFNHEKNILKVIFVRIDKRNVKKVDNIKLFIPQMQTFSNFFLLSNHLIQLRQNNANLSQQIQEMKSDNLYLTSGVEQLKAIKTEIQRQIVQSKKDSKNILEPRDSPIKQEFDFRKSEATNQHIHAQERRPLVVQKEQNLSQGGEIQSLNLSQKTHRSINCQKNHEQAESCKKTLSEQNLTNRLLELKRPPPIVDSYFEQESEAMEPRKKTKCASEQFFSHSSIREMFYQLQQNLSHNIKNTISDLFRHQHANSSIPLQSYPQKTTFNRLQHRNKKHPIKLAPLMKSHVKKQQIKPNVSNNLNDRLGTKIFLTVDTNSDYFAQYFSIDEPFTVRKKCSVDCFQVLCNQLIPTTGKWYFEVYLEQITFGLFSIGVFSPRRRNFQISHDSPDCVVMFGIGFKICKNSGFSGKQVTGHSQYARENISKNFGRHQPKLKDDTTMKVAIDRNDHTIRWYQDDEELGSTSMPEHLRNEKLLPGFHMNGGNDKVRLNEFYPDEEM